MLQQDAGQKEHVLVKSISHPEKGKSTGQKPGDLAKARETGRSDFWGRNSFNDEGDCPKSVCADSCTDPLPHVMSHSEAVS